MTPRKEHRRSLLINPAFQRPLIVYAAITAVLMAGFVLIPLTFVLKKIRMDLYAAQPPLPATLLATIDHRYTSLYALGAAITTFMVVVMAAMAMIFSHRVAGPLHRLNGYLLRLSSWSDGDGATMPKLSFRKGDFFPELAVSCNEAVRNIREGSAASNKVAERRD